MSDYLKDNRCELACFA